MIDYLDTLLHRLFLNRVAGLTDDGQVRFQPPDEDWRAMVPDITDSAGHPANSLNIYLIDLRENRKLRSNARERRVIDQDVYETPPPRRVDCHYLISAWSPVRVTPGTDPTLDEHALLAEAARVLGEHDELDPVTIYAPMKPPAPIADERFPITLLPVEGFPKLAEFWGTMGDKHRWKPCVYAVITVALRETPLRAGPIVTTMITDTFTRTPLPGTVASIETRYRVGGVVLDNASPPKPVPLAWVDLLTPAGERRRFTHADKDGRFVFDDITAGNWQLQARAVPFGVSAPRPVTVPEPGGTYDVAF